jgi:hypothetical protein
MTDEFVLAVLSKYIANVKSIHDLEHRMKLAGNWAVRQCSSAGAWITLPKCNDLLVDLENTKRVWTDLVAQVNGSIIDVILYVEDQHIQELELAAPLGEMPAKISHFEFVQLPNERLLLRREVR